MYEGRLINLQIVLLNATYKKYREKNHHHKMYFLFGYIEKYQAEI